MIRTRWEIRTWWDLLTLVVMALNVVLALVASALSFALHRHQAGVFWAFLDAYFIVFLIWKVKYARG